MWRERYYPSDENSVDGVRYDDHYGGQFGGRGVAYGESQYRVEDYPGRYAWRRELLGERDHEYLGERGRSFRWCDDDRRNYTIHQEVSQRQYPVTRREVACQTTAIPELLPLRLAWRIGGRARGPTNARGGRGRVQRNRNRTIRPNSKGAHDTAVRTTQGKYASRREANICARGPTNTRGGRGRAQRYRDRTIRPNSKRARDTAVRTTQGKYASRREANICTPKSPTHPHHCRNIERRREGPSAAGVRAKKIRPSSATLAGSDINDQQSSNLGLSSANLAESENITKRDSTLRKVESVVVKLCEREFKTGPCSAQNAGSGEEKIAKEFAIGASGIVPPSEWSRSAQGAGPQRGERDTKHATICHSPKRINEISLGNCEDGERRYSEEPTLGKVANSEAAPMESSSTFPPPPEIHGFESSDFDDYEFLDPPPTPGGSIPWPELF